MTNPGDILAYIEQSEGRFTRETIDAELIRSGHDQAAIDAAWTAYQARPRPPLSRNTGSKVAAVILGLLVVAAYGLAVLAALLWASTAGTFGGSGWGWLMIVYAVAMIIGGGFSLKRFARAPSKEHGGQAVAIAFVISLVIFVGLSGACFAVLLAPRG